jgi:RNA polymerase sigma-70 factor (ECF subfamily)
MKSDNSGPVPLLPALNQKSSSNGLSASSDGALVARCLAGDLVAWRTLYDRYSQQVFRFMGALGVPPEEREDAAQDVFISVYRGLSQFRGDAQLSTWIYRIAARHASRLGRRRRFRALMSLRFTPEPEPEREADPIARSSDLRLLERMLSNLSPKKRAVLVLFEIEGLHVDEIAKVVGSPENTVWSRLHHARAELIKMASKVSR